MKQINLIYYSVFFLWYLLSLLPLRFLYFISDLLFYPLYYCIRYRRKIIRNNLSNSFPEKDLKEIVQIEKQFYSFFCDYIVETLKLFSISKKQLMRRMTFEGLDEIVESMNKKEQRFLFYLFRALLQLGMDCILALLDFQRHILRTNLSSTVQSGFRQTISKITQPVRRRMHPHENDFAPHH